MNIIDEGLLSKIDGSSEKYEILHGWDISLSQKCDIQWGSYKLSLYEYIHKNISDDKIDEMLNSIVMEDNHWNWFSKSVHYKQENYKWFHLIADNEIQGACIVYQPKKSFIDQENIFYIEYIAAAPWNRRNLINDKRFNGVGTILLSSISKFISNNYNFRLGFSLHSLPQATSYYEKIGMINYSQNDKSPLKYYEMPETDARKIFEVQNDK